MTIAIIGDEEAVLGFKLAGLKNAVVFQEDKLNETLENFINVKILVVTEDIAIHIKKQAWFLEKFKGVLIEIPTKAGSTGSAMKEISKLFENAIGVKLKEQSN
jgi:vacuolar-type H+-ATPase subunit F/Vma7